VTLWSGHAPTIDAFDQVRWQCDQEARWTARLQTAHPRVGWESSRLTIDEVQKHLRAGESHIRQAPLFFVGTALPPCSGWTCVRDKALFTPNHEDDRPLSALGTMDGAEECRLCPTEGWAVDVADVHVDQPGRQVGCWRTLQYRLEL